MPFGANGHVGLAHNRFTHGNINGHNNPRLWLIQKAENRFVFTFEFSRFPEQHCEVWLEGERTMKMKVRRSSCSGTFSSNTITLVSLKLDFLLSQRLIPE